MKVLSENDIRPNDRADLQALIRVASVADLARAGALVRLIHERGYHRDLDLKQRFEAFVAQYGSGA